ncbi:MAG: 2-amino-4-hydroxy-6-hydroxymethyldihydropteridine diphosphokinase [Gammaproteobacteria bacterium]|nr:2-amino-4-hydroxy-6-hydroxymethyldihydropteridine diphosphokinase [Gammaproteobacteria bacterium]MDH5304439.1 2-amino-4-hydroxy-6-hydroxymethyldihydropteridine diphosphokinase [Gammaproteobacteria bacterium]MDH5322211.1 2-amino-4-hydroxy-6-hydroxymethyldihydropteridine diphosphokinase [Gammaproteobacteria bacterium]
MARVYLGLGSNIEPQKNLRLGITELGKRFGMLELSGIYRNAAIGFDGDEFLNLVVALESDASPLAVYEILDDIERLAKRQRDAPRFAARTLDIDLLLYGDLILNEAPLQVPRVDILEYSFVLGPLAEIAPNLRHPETGRLITEHWAEFDKDRHPLVLTRVSLRDTGENLA